MYAGTYTEGSRGGIYAAVFSAASGELTELRLAARPVHPSFLAVHPGGGVLYAVSEQAAGSAGAWAIDPSTGELKFLDQVSSGGVGPCHVAVDGTGQVAIVANYGSGSTSAIRILDDGRLGAVASHQQRSGSGPRLPRQSKPHPHGAFFSQDNRLVVVPDLGCDTLHTFRFNAEIAALEPTRPGAVTMAAGAGPRHFAFHRSGGFGYALCELDSTVTGFLCDTSAGSLQPLSTFSTLPGDFHGENIAAEIAIDAAGRYLYCSNRGADTIAVYRVGADGIAEIIQHAPAMGRTPRHFAIDPSGLWLLVANQDSDCVAVFRRDPDSGRLEPTGRSLPVPSPACLVFRRL
jgi:6-phosphogluconolactonase